MELGFKKRRDTPITVVLADDQPEVRRALTRYLTRDGRFEVIGEAEDGEQAVEIVTSLRPDALIIDLAMPKMNGLLATRQISEHAPETKIIVLSSNVPFGTVREDAADAGATAVFDKYTPPKKLIKAILEAIED